MMNLLEEGAVTELGALKTKKFLNENLGRIRGMLVEEGVMDAVKSHMAKNWGNYLAGLAAAGVGGAAGLADQYYNDGGVANYVGDTMDQTGQYWGGVGQDAANYAANTMDQTGQYWGGVGQDIANYATPNA
jgi:hypothetical protein